MELRNDHTSLSVVPLLVGGLVLLSLVSPLLVGSSRLMETLFLLHSGLDYHKDTTHSFFLGGYQSVQCARNTGIYSGAFLALVWVWATGRGRAQEFPPLRVALALALFIGVMIADGVNSFVADMGYAAAYPPSIPLRLGTGLLAGAAVGLYFLPVLNGILWRDRDQRRVVPSYKALAPLLTVLVLIWVIVVAGLDLLAVPVALLTTLAALGLFGAVNLLFFVLLVKADNRFIHVRELSRYGVVSLAVAFVQMLLLAWFMHAVILKV